MKYSRQRNLILDIVRTNPVHPTAEWVYEQARKEIPAIGLATVYRNLNMLASLGEIEKIPGVDGVDRFDGDCSEHYHLKCSRCGRLYDLQSRDGLAETNLKKMIAETFLLEPADVTLNPELLEGLCDRCRESKADMEE